MTKQSSKNRECVQNALKYMTIEADKEPRGAFFIALGAFLMWGFLPIYLKSMHETSPWVIVCARIIWTIPWAFMIAAFFDGISSIKVSKRTLLFLALSGAFISGNWTLYTWSVNNGMIMEAALGYFINPLMNIAVGILVFKEKLEPLKIAAVGMAAIAVLYQSIMAHHFPLIGLVLAASFTVYALIRKQVKVSAGAGLFWEAVSVAPIAFIALYFLDKENVAIFGARPIDGILLLLAGPFTAIPLAMFSYGARRLKMSTIGMLQYVAPSIVFVISLLYGESFNIHKAITFALIWAGLGIYSWAEFGKKS